MRAPSAVVAVVLLAALSGCTGSDDPTAAPSPSDAASSAPSVAAPTVDVAAEQARLARTYPTALRPTVESVYDQVQPLVDAFDAFDRPRVENAQVRDDVFAAGGTRLALEARLKELRTAEAPTAFGPRVRQLDAALAALGKAAGVLSAATRATPGAGGTVPQYQQGEKALDAAITTWATAVTAVYGGKGVPLTPRHGRTGVRAPSSKGAWLYAAGRTCGQAAGARVAAAELPKVPLPVADAARLKAKVLAPLAQVRAGKGRPALAAAANGLAEYGSSVCAGLFAVREG
ncbi:MAG: hypothetical protein JWM64_2414 [Frankiales bacterium]|nr:hypothetical protein [Frankiales bacterium]